MKKLDLIKKSIEKRVRKITQASSTGWCFLGNPILKAIDKAYELGYKDSQNVQEASK